tara:strand:+ start:249 stop:1325 length:1077 start_codon:yes stop_codon:yes gene_type:complete
MAAIDFKTFHALMPFVTNTDDGAAFPVLIRGRHGIGKSAVVYAYGATRDLPVVERRASQMTEGDLLGLPNTDGNRTSWNPPDWFAEACERPVVLFLDEVDRATTEVRQGIFELCDSRKIAGNELHPETLIFAAINGGEHGAQYQVSEMDPAELDRYTVYDVEPTVEDWLDWAKDRVNEVVWDFINQNRVHLEHTGEFEPNKVYPSRRSWDRFNKSADAGNLFAESSEVLYQLAASFVGFEAAVAFNDFVREYERQVAVEDILDAGNIEKTSDFEINEHTAMVDKLEASGAFAAPLAENQVVNLASYFVTLPSEVAMKLWTVVGNCGNQDNVIALHKATAADGTVVGEYMVRMLRGDDA